MTINSLTAGSTSSLAYTGRASGTSSATSASATQQTGGMRPPPPDDGGGLIGAIADALKSIGLDGSADTDSTSASASDGTADSETGTANAAQALGSFLENLMGALHAQNGGEAGASPAYGEPPQGGPGMGGGPGKLSADLQSLISALGDSTDSTGATDDTDNADTSVSALQSSFKSLLTALGGDGADADSKLSGFLQTLSANLPSAGSSGNLINTTA